MADADTDTDINTDVSRRDAWTSYWASGPLHSCMGSFDAGYSGAIGKFWQRAFAEVRPGDRILDLASGNGPLPLLLWRQYGAAAQLRIDAVDLAGIAPGWYAPATHAGIRFHSGVAMEALPFAEDSFDWVVSQFGVEYARRPDAWNESLRVARPGAHFAFVMHHADSVLVAVARQEIDNLRDLLGEHGLVEAARSVMPWIARARQYGVQAASTRAALASRERYNTAMAETSRRIETNPVPDTLVDARQWIHELVSGARGGEPSGQLRLLADYRSSLEAAMLRSSELVRHALDEHEVMAVLAHFKAARPGSEVSCETVRQSEGVLGWGLRVVPDAVGAG